MSLHAQRVLVTGAGGFIGSHLVEALVQRGAEVRALVRYGSRGDRGWLGALPGPIRDAVEVVAGDVRDAGSMERATRDVAVVFHLAALGGVPYSFIAPEAYVETNIKGTLNLLEASRRAGVARVVVTSSSEVYGTARAVPIDESHPLRAQSPYAASKIAADKLAESFALSFGMEIVTVRPFNAYGPRQSARAVIPTILTQLVSGAQTLRLGRVGPRRDFTYVTDLARAFVAAAESARTGGEVLQVASGVDISIGELAAGLIARVRPGTPVELDDQRLRPEAAEVERLVGSSAKLRALTGWTPTWTLEAGLDATVEWFSDPANMGHIRSGRYEV